MIGPARRHAATGSAMREVSASEYTSDIAPRRVNVAEVPKDWSFRMTPPASKPPNLTNASGLNPEQPACF
jgi:hypothetical protein